MSEARSLSYQAKICDRTLCTLAFLQIMVKGKGIFVNPASAAAPAKLRVLYEVGPIAYLIEKAGGKSSDGENSALDIKIPNTEVRERNIT